MAVLGHPPLMGPRGGVGSTQLCLTSQCPSKKDVYREYKPGDCAFLQALGLDSTDELPDR